MEPDGHEEALFGLRARLGNLSRNELRALAIFCGGLVGLRDSLVRGRMSRSREYWLLLGALQLLLPLGPEAEPVMAKARTVMEAAFETENKHT
jgi:hypothetical protein